MNFERKLLPDSYLAIDFIQYIINKLYFVRIREHLITWNLITYLTVSVNDLQCGRPLTYFNYQTHITYSKEKTSRHIRIQNIKTVKTSYMTQHALTILTLVARKLTLTRQTPAAE